MFMHALSMPCPEAGRRVKNARSQPEASLSIIGLHRRKINSSGGGIADRMRHCHWPSSPLTSSSLHTETPKGEEAH